jgi:biopolymer transport protein ExbD
MSSSLRARRMARNHRRLAQTPRLNLVALMDIFTILVLFLMVNNGDVEVLQPERNITLP